MNHSSRSFQKFVYAGLASLLFLIFLSACNSPSDNQTADNLPVVLATSTPTPTIAASPTITSTSTPSPTPTPTEHPGWLPEGAVARIGKGYFYDIAASPDNQVVAIAASGGVYLVDPESARVVNFIETNSLPLDLKFSPDGQHLYIGNGKDGVQIWSTTSGNSWDLEETLQGVCGKFIEISGDGNTLFAKCFSKNNFSFTSWDLATLKQNFRLDYQIPFTNFFAMAFSPVDPSLAVFARGEILSLIDVKTGKVIRSYSEPDRNTITDVDFSPDGKILAISPNSPIMILLDSETFEEIRRIEHKSKVFMSSFIDENKIISITENSYVIQDISGKSIKSVEHYGMPHHEYLPKNNMLVVNGNNSVDFIFLDSTNKTKKITGFEQGYWQSTSISGDGNAFLTGNQFSGKWEYFFRNINDPDRVEYLTPDMVCSDARWIDFVDNEGLLASVTCPDKNEMRVFDLKNLQVLQTYDLPDGESTNTSYYSHPWRDERQLTALFYENSESDEAKTRVEIRDVINGDLVSKFDLPEVNAEKLWAADFSPTSSFLVMNSKDEKKFLVLDVMTGDLVREIPNNSYPGTNGLTSHEFTFIKDESMVLVREGKFAEVYSLETGELIQKYSYLKSENLTFFDETDRLLTYYLKTRPDGTAEINFDVYSLESDKKLETYTVHLTEPGSFETLPDFRPSYQFDSQFDELAGGDGTVLYQSEGNGNTAAVFTHYYSRKTAIDIYKIYFLDIPAGIVTGSFVYQYDGWRKPHIYINGDYLFSQHLNSMFKWDLSLK